MVLYFSAHLFQDFPLGGGPDGSTLGPGMGHGGPGGPPGGPPCSMSGPPGPGGGPGPVMNGGEGLEMKNSPANGGPGTPREDGNNGPSGPGGPPPNMGDYSLGGYSSTGENVSLLHL